MECLLFLLSKKVLKQMNRKWDFYKKIQLARTDVGKYMAGYFSRRIHNCAATFLRFFSIWQKAFWFSHECDWTKFMYEGVRKVTNSKRNGAKM